MNQDKIGEVKKILDQPIAWIKGMKRAREGIRSYLTEPCRDKLSEQICQLFEQDRIETAHQTFKAIRASLKGDPTVFPIALDSIEVDWLYKQSRKLFVSKPKGRMDSTHSPKCQQRVERLSLKIKEYFKKTGYRSEEEFMWWQALWKEQGVK